MLTISLYHGKLVGDWLLLQVTLWRSPEAEPLGKLVSPANTNAFRKTSCKQVSKKGTGASEFNSLSTDLKSSILVVGGKKEQYF